MVRSIFLHLSSLSAWRHLDRSLILGMTFLQASGRLPIIPHNVEGVKLALLHLMLLKEARIASSYNQ